MNRIIVIVIAIALLPIMGMAQQEQQEQQKQITKYNTFIYITEDLADEIKYVNDTIGEDDARSLGADIFNSAINAGKGIASGYVTSVIDLGVNAIANLVTRNSRLQSEWLNDVEAENSWSTNINSIQDIKDFYNDTSEKGALDPLGMRFDGIGCLRMEGNDTVFFVSCHIDRSKLDRIVKHSKFELVLDTLILSPEHSNLPNSKLPITYSFDERKDFNLSMDIKLTSSWFTDVIDLHNDEQLGEFTINVGIDQKMVDDKGYFRYARKKGETPRYEITGESFIVPRSYMPIRDKYNNYKNSWGTGEYKLSIDIKETCNLTDQFKENWKNDRKRRKNLQKSQEKEGKQNVFSNIWKTVTTQKWDEISQSWIITVLNGPANVLTQELIEKMGSDSTGTTTSSNMSAQH